MLWCSYVAWFSGISLTFFVQYIKTQCTHKNEFYLVKSKNNGLRKKLVPLPTYYMYINKYTSNLVAGKQVDVPFSCFDQMLLVFIITTAVTDSFNGCCCFCCCSFGNVCCCCCLFLILLNFFHCEKCSRFISREIYYCLKFF